MDQLLDISTWIPTTVLVILGFLGRNLIKTRLSASVQHEYNAKLKALESELRATEKSLAADIEAKQREIDALRNGPLTLISKRQELVFDRRVDALDKIWNSVCESKRLHNAPSTLKSLDISKIAQSKTINSDLAKFVSDITSNIQLEDLNFFKEYYRYRPHVSILVWAYFAAYEAIIYKSIFTVHILRKQMDTALLNIQDKSAFYLIKTALPELNLTEENFRFDMSYDYLEFLESRLLEAIKFDLQAHDLDEQSINRANSVISAAKNLIKEDAKSNDKKVSS